MFIGLALILIAAFLQGSFMLPMGMTRAWCWEHIWAVFSLFGMVFLNWLLFVTLLPDALAIYASVPLKDLVTLFLFGAGWGLGAVLFGLGMDRLGLVIGYPLIMGLSALTGALVPLFSSKLDVVFSSRGGVVCLGTVIAIAGIIVCSAAGAQKHSSSEPGSAFTSGLLIALAAGLLCSLPNVGLAFGRSTIEAARSVGASVSTAGNAVWCVFFTAGGLVNVGYCVWCMLHKGNFKKLIAPNSLRNWVLGGGMALLWIGSFYAYGFGASRLGAWGPIIGWPVLIAGSIGVGVLWGFRQGEWKDAPTAAIRMLGGGLVLIMAAVITLAMSNLA